MKVKSADSFEKYIKTQVFMEWGINNIELEVRSFESKNSYCIQAADFIANAGYSLFEYGDNCYFSLLNEKVSSICKYPLSKFNT